MSETAILTRTQPVQQRGGARVEQIMRAALVVLKREGRDRFTTAQVAVEAGVSIGTVYRYFKDRVAILDAVWPDRESPFPPEDLEA